MSDIKKESEIPKEQNLIPFFYYRDQLMNLDDLEKDSQVWSDLALALEDTEKNIKGHPLATDLAEGIRRIKKELGINETDK